MELVTVKCTVCGKSLEIDADTEFVKCPACGETFSIKTGKEFEENYHAFKELDIKNAWENLRRCLGKDLPNVGEIRSWAAEIQHAIPGDYLAGLYKLYPFSSPEYQRYLKNTDIGGVTERELTEALEFSLKVLRSRNIQAVREFLNKLIMRNLEFSKYSDVLNEAELRCELRDEELNPYIQRDVFVAYSGADRALAEELMRGLEEDGFSCWISSRNLDHLTDDKTEYEKSIYAAIENCTILDRKSVV